MTISQKNSMLSEIESGLPIPKSKRAYFQARLQHRLYDFVVTKFQEKAKAEGLTKAELARRIGRRPESITRLLCSPGNWRLETVSDLLLGIAAEELDMASTSLLNRAPRNFNRPDWATSPLHRQQAVASQPRNEFRMRGIESSLEKTAPVTSAVATMQLEPAS